MAKVVDFNVTDVEKLDVITYHDTAVQKLKEEDIEEKKEEKEKEKKLKEEMLGGSTSIAQSSFDI